MIFGVGFADFGQSPAPTPVEGQVNEQIAVEHQRRGGVDHWSGLVCRTGKRNRSLPVAASIDTTLSRVTKIVCSTPSTVATVGDE